MSPKVVRPKTSSQVDFCSERKACPRSDCGALLLHLSGTGVSEEAELRLPNYAQLQQPCYLSGCYPN